MKPLERTTLRGLLSGIGLALLWLCLAGGCSVRKYAVNKIGDALASGGSVYESEEDLELAKDALPFSLKLIETLLAESPRHRGLLQTACKGFTTYSYIFVHNEADFQAHQDLSLARRLRERARRLYLRALRYGLRGLEASYPGIRDSLFTQPVTAAARIRRKEDVPLAYWTAAALGLAISVSRNDASLLARLPEVEALVGRAIELDEDWAEGTLHEFEIVLAGARAGKPDYDEMRHHFERALALSREKRAGLFVAYAEAVAVPQQDQRLFTSLLDRALSIDPDADEEARLANLVAQRRARWLVAHADDLILPQDQSIGSGLRSSFSSIPTSPQ